MNQLKGAEREAANRQSAAQFAARYNEETKEIEKSIKQFNSRREQGVQRRLKIEHKKELEASKDELAARQVSCYFRI